MVSDIFCNFAEELEDGIAQVQTTPNPSSLGFAAWLVQELRRGNDYTDKRFKKVINMKRETINKVANFILTVITAFVSTFLMQSCM